MRHYSPVIDGPEPLEPFLERLERSQRSFDPVLARFAELEARIWRLVNDTERIALRIHPTHPWR